MADDMGIGDTTVYNPDSRIPTPNLERLDGTDLIVWFRLKTTEPVTIRLVPVIR